MIKQQYKYDGAYPQDLMNELPQSQLFKMFADNNNVEMPLKLDEESELSEIVNPITEENRRATTDTLNSISNMDNEQSATETNSQYGNISNFSMDETISTIEVDKLQQTVSMYK